MPTIKPIKSKKGFELSMQIIIIAIILLVVLGFVLWFFLGRGEWLSGTWSNVVEGSISQTEAAVK